MKTTHERDVNSLSEEQRRALAHRVWREANRRVLVSMGSISYCEYVIGSDAPVNRIQTLYGDDGAMIGYVSFRTVNK